MHADAVGVNRLPERIVPCASQVLNTLGAGSLEKIYQNTLAPTGRIAHGPCSSPVHLRGLRAFAVKISCLPTLSPSVAIL
jgi:hypothetical protein